jgi:hypothetical protein
MKIGDLVLLRGGMWSSYGREGEIGLILETLIPTTGVDKETFSRVWWSKDGAAKLYKSEHLKVISESR